MVEPAHRYIIGELAERIYKQKYSNLLNRLLDTSSGQVGRIVDGARNSVRGDLLSLLFVCREVIEALIHLGATDAKAVVQRARLGEDIWSRP